MYFLRFLSLFLVMIVAMGCSSKRVQTFSTSEAQVASDEIVHLTVSHNDPFGLATNSSLWLMGKDVQRHYDVVMEDKSAVSGIINTFSRNAAVIPASYLLGSSFPDNVGDNITQQGGGASAEGGDASSSADAAGGTSNVRIQSSPSATSSSSSSSSASSSSQ